MLGGCEVSDRAGSAYVDQTSSHPSFGMVRIHQRTFVPAPPTGSDQLELRFRAPGKSEGRCSSSPRSICGSHGQANSLDTT